MLRERLALVGAPEPVTPPEFDIEMASWTPLTRPPVRMPKTASTPKNVPATSGVSMTNAAGAIISLRDAFVEISTQAS